MPSTRRSTIGGAAALITGTLMAAPARARTGTRADRRGTDGTPAATPEPNGPLTLTGDPGPAGSDALDETLTDLVAEWGLPGAQVAVGIAGDVVYDRACGYADPSLDEPMLPDHRLRIASVSKTFTAVAILRLVQDGRLTLDTPVFPLLDLAPPDGAVVDPVLDTVTVRHLLIHAGGYDSTVSGDPQYFPLSIVASSVLGAPAPATGETIIRFMLGAGLDFEPGTRAVYSNFGFNVLGRVIERVTGAAYGDAIQTLVLGPAGITDMALGQSLERDRLDGEVRYVAPPEYPPAVPSVFPAGGYVPIPYGSFNLAAMDAQGGWVARASDLVRYAMAIDGLSGTAILEPDTVEAMLTEPHPPFTGANGAANTDPATGLGWVVQQGPLGREWAHTGGLGGSTAALLFRNDAGLTLAFLTNTLPADFLTFFAALRPAMTEALAALDPGN